MKFAFKSIVVAAAFVAAGAANAAIVTIDGVAAAGDQYTVSGDGALTFGWGIYLTDNIKVARMFRKRGSGKLFHVEKPAYPRMVNVMRG